MKKSNGFAISTMLYSIFGIMLMIIFYILYTLTSNKMVLTTSINNVKKGLESNKVNVTFVIDQAMPNDERILYLNKIKSFSETLKNNNLNVKITYNYTINKLINFYFNGGISTVDTCTTDNCRTDTNGIYGIIGNKILYSDGVSNRVCYIDLKEENSSCFECPVINGCLKMGGDNYNEGAGAKIDSNNNFLYVYSYDSYRWSPTEITYVYDKYSYDNQGNITFIERVTSYAWNYDAPIYTPNTSTYNRFMNEYNALPSTNFFADANEGAIYATSYNELLDKTIINNSLEEYTIPNENIYNVNGNFGIVYSRDYSSSGSEIFFRYFVPEHTQETLDFVSDEQQYNKNYYIILKSDNINRWNTYDFNIGDNFNISNLEKYKKYVIAEEKSKEIIQNRLNGDLNTEYFDYDYNNSFQNLDIIFNKIINEIK